MFIHRAKLRLSEGHDARINCRVKAVSRRLRRKVTKNFAKECHLTRLNSVKALFFRKKIFLRRFFARFGRVVAKTLRKFGNRRKML